MKEKEMSLNLCVTCGFDYTYSLKILLLPLKLCTCACLGKKRYGSVGMKTQKGAISKLNRAIPSSAVGAGFTCPKGLPEYTKQTAFGRANLAPTN